MSVIQFDFHDRGFWFRVFGFGVRVIDRSKVSAPFSIRNGYRKEWLIFGFGVAILTPTKI